MARKRINLSFSKRNEDIYELLKGLDDGVSEYVCGLVRQDQKKENVIDMILQKVGNIEKRLDGKALADISPMQKDIWEIDTDIESMILNEDD